MTSVKIEAHHLGDPRWIDAGADAFAVHVWALSYCDQQRSDGLIHRRLAEREALAVAPTAAAEAIDRLILLGLWEISSDGICQICEYESYCLPSAEIRATSTRWADDRKRRRHHNNGLHDLCDPKKCPGASAADIGRTPPDVPSVSGPRPAPYTQLDQTRPDPTVGRGSGSGEGSRRSVASTRSAGATRAPAPPRHHLTPAAYGATPGVEIEEDEPA